MRTIAVIVFLFIAPMMRASGQESVVSLDILEQWSTVFGGKEAAFHVLSKSTQPFRGRIEWRLSADERTIVRGEAEINMQAHAQTTTDISLQVPEVKAGVVMETRLAVSVRETEGADIVSQTNRTLWVFPEDPFVDRKEWLKALRIHLFDPEDTTSGVFEAEVIPFVRIRNIDSFESIADGILVIGSGVSLRDFRGLADAMVTTAAAGTPVLCLSLTSGEMTLPGMTGGDLPRPKSLVFRRSDVIGSFDKRLDDVAWAPGGDIAASSLLVRAERGSIRGEVHYHSGSAENGEESKGSVRQLADGWPWLEMEFAEGAKLVFCGFGIVEKWDFGPTPRFLFSEILEHIEDVRE